MSRAPRAITIDDLRAKRAELLHAVESLGATNVRVFGPVARNEADGQSDVDLFVDIVADVHGFDYFSLLEDLRVAFEEILGRSVHVVDAASLDRMRDRVSRDASPLFDVSVRAPDRSGTFL